MLCKLYILLKNNYNYIFQNKKILSEKNSVVLHVYRSLQYLV